MVMMEAMQIGPAHFGPQLVGPGTGTVGGCVFEPTLGRGAFQRIAEKNLDVAEKAMIIDAATAHSEQKGEIGHYKLLAKNTTYRNKITDEIVSEKTLVSPDFNYEAAGVWTSAGEKGTVGTIEEYRATVDRVRELAQIEADASMFWVSPSSESDVHRAYLWVKTGDTVEAYQYIIPGRRKAVSTMMKKLGYQNDDSKPLEEQTIIRLGNEPKIHHKDVFDAVISSLSFEEAKKAKSILDKFRQEAEIPDSFRKQRLKDYQGEYEAKLNNEKLKKVYENDIKKWLTSVAQGFAAIDRIDSNGGTRESMLNDKSLTADKTKRDNLAYYDYQSMQDNKDKLDKKETILRVLLPITPGIIGLTGVFVEYSKDFEKERISQAEQSSIDAPKIDNINENRLDHTVFESGYEDTSFTPFYLAHLPGVLHGESIQDESNAATWKVLRSDSFQVKLVEKNSHCSSDAKLVQVEEKTEFFTWERSFRDTLSELFPMMVDKGDEFQQSLNKEGLSVLTMGLQQGLEVIATIIKSEESIGLTAGQKEEKTRRQRVETDVVKIGEEIVGMILSGENKLQLSDSLARLSFLINVYKDKNSKDVVKHLLAVLIYKQIEKIYEDKQMLVLHPELAIISSKFTKLYKDTRFLEGKFNLLLLYLGKIDSANIFDKSKFESTNKDLISRIIFVIFKNLQRQISAEKLPHRNTLVTTDINSAYLVKKKKQKKPSKQGVIYWFNNQVIYQYSSLLVTQTCV